MKQSKKIVDDLSTDSVFCKNKQWLVRNADAHYGEDPEFPTMKQIVCILNLFYVMKCLSLK